MKTNLKLFYFGFVVLFTVFVMYGCSTTYSKKYWARFPYCHAYNGPPKTSDNQVCKIFAPAFINIKKIVSTDYVGERKAPYCRKIVLLPGQYRLLINYSYRLSNTWSNSDDIILKLDCKAGHIYGIDYKIVLQDIKTVGTETSRRGIWTAWIEDITLAPYYRWHDSERPSLQLIK